MFSKTQENEQKESAEDKEKEAVAGESQEDLHMLKILSKYDAEDVRTSVLPWA